MCIRDREHGALCDTAAAAAASWHRSSVSDMTYSRTLVGSQYSCAVFLYQVTVAAMSKWLDQKYGSVQRSVHTVAYRANLYTVAYHDIVGN